MVHLRSLFTEKNLMAEAEEHALNSYHIKRISSIIWMVTYRCNLKCKHCHEGFDKPSMEELNTHEAVKVIEELSAAGKPLLFISGGEPLLRDDIHLLLKESVKRGMRVILSSNGTLIDEDAADKIADTGVNCAAIPLYGPKELHEHFTHPAHSTRSLRPSAIFAIEMYKPQEEYLEIR